ncbi:MAG: NAD(P)/FAD-dependent oxidoreductase [Alphaproteobacteria bacterium]
MESGSVEKRTGKRHIVVVGAGFGGLHAAKALRRAPADITIVDRQNHHLFQPLLYQVATAGLSPADIAWPIRSILSGQKNARVVLDEVIGVDATRREVILAEGGPLPYDFLVLATGSRHSYFGHNDWEAGAPGLKSLDDATAIRRRILLAFERAEKTSNKAGRARQLTFVIVGGGPTGVELAGTLAELARRALAADFRLIDPKEARIVLMEAGPRLLPSMPETLSAFARRSLESMGVEVRTEEAVAGIDSEGVTIDRGDGSAARIMAATVVWAAGNEASPAGRWLGAETDTGGRVQVSPDLAVPGHPEIFAIGDTARVLDADGRPLPGIAPVARQQGRYAAQVILARLRSSAPPGPFRYRDSGLWATIGRNAAVISWKQLRLRGSLAWWLWGLVHIYFLMDMRSRLLVLIGWLWAYVTFGRGARLITGVGASVANAGGRDTDPRDEPRHKQIAEQFQDANREGDRTGASRGDQEALGPQQGPA